MDIKALQWELAAFVVDRGLDPLHTPRNLSIALAAEAGTLLALFKWLADDDGPGLATPAQRNAAADALADSVLHAIHLADRLGIELDEAIRRKLARNAEKYPALPRETPAPVAAAPERRGPSDRRVGSDRRVASERRYEPERRLGPDRRVEPERRSSPARARTAAEPEAPARSEPPLPPAREPLPAARPAPPTSEETRSPSPPPSRAARTEAPRARIPEPPPPPLPPSEPVARYEPPPPPPPEPVARYEPPPPPPPEPVARYEPPPPKPEPPEEEVDPYAYLDVDATRRIVEILSKQVNRARSDDPLARELHDEVATLKRTLYADDPKRAWVAGSLKSIRRILDEATAHSVGAELRAAEHLAEVERILKD